ncbi:hypothetical protein ABEB36_014831 [Hypothenemus hampei]|uniref:TIR domain-containing protein n=1 Tax=Hypothenemus hampei TaxID=57062 RepID=A0ABD1E1A0_HYPHA
MASISTIFWISTILILTKAGVTFGVNCTNVNKKQCTCFDSEDIEIQCPIRDSKVGIFISSNDNIKIQCMDNSLLDLERIPNLKISDSKFLQLEYCNFNGNFTEVVNKFDIKNLSKLSFEGVNQHGAIYISKESFNGLDNLELLSLSYSTFLLEEDFLANTPNLAMITLKQNSLTQLDNYFDYVPNLKNLELNNNEISHIPERVFNKLNSLSRLFLFDNNITSLSKDSFVGLENLKLLELSSNHISNITEDAFSDLPILVNLSLRGNRIRKIYLKLFAKNSFLENLRLASNPGVIIEDGAFNNLTHLKTIDLSLNNITEVSEDIFKYCKNLVSINLDQNLLRSLPVGVFRNLRKLSELNLSRNKLTALSANLFDKLQNLKKLDLSFNQLIRIEENLFGKLINLQRLDLHRNKISYIYLRAFEQMSRTITYMDISYNKWNNSYIFPEFSAFDPLVSIKELILNHNEFIDVPIMLAALNLEFLDLSYNKINSLEIHPYIQKQMYPLTIDLSNNLLENVNFILVEQNWIQNVNNTDEIGKSTTIKLANNPIVCDCNMYDLARYNVRDIDLKNIVNLQLDGVFCANESKRIVDVKPQDIQCKVLEGCPNICGCNFEPFRKAMVVDCSFKELEAYPEFKFNTSEFAYNQTVLIMRGNNLTKEPYRINDSYDNITKLDLSQNLLSSVSWVPPRLVELNLSTNLYRNLDGGFVRKLKNTTTLINLYLKDNPWECTCKSLDIQKYLIQFYYKVNSSDIYCERQMKELIKLVDLCHVSPYLSVLLPVILFILLLFSILFALYYRYQTEVKIYLYAKQMCLWFVSEEELDKDKIYDVFVSYAHQDESFVIEHLLPELEKPENPFKVCIHIRDWFPGEFIADQVIRSVRDSKRTLVVLSNHFVESVWGKMEFRTAHSQAISEGRARVIVVILGDLDESKLDDELKKYLTTNTYVKWGDKYFWRKLKYALPHSKEHFYESNKKHAQVMLKIDDQFNLIKCNPPSPCNTSTPPIILDPSLLESQPNLKKIDAEDRLLEKYV